MEEQLLRSDNHQSVLFGLKYFTDQDYWERFDLIVAVMQRGNPLLNFYIAKNLPARVFQSENYRKLILETWDKLDKNTRSVLSDQLEMVPLEDPDAHKKN